MSMDRVIQHKTSRGSAAFALYPMTDSMTCVTCGSSDRSNTWYGVYNGLECWYCHNKKIARENNDPVHEYLAMKPEEKEMLDAVNHWLARL